MSYLVSLYNQILNIHINMDIKTLLRRLNLIQIEEFIHVAFTSQTVLLCCKLALKATPIPIAGTSRVYMLLGSWPIQRMCRSNRRAAET